MIVCKHSIYERTYLDEREIRSEALQDCGLRLRHAPVGPTWRVEHPRQEVVVAAELCLTYTHTALE